MDNGFLNLTLNPNGQIHHDADLDTLYVYGYTYKCGHNIRYGLIDIW